MSPFIRLLLTISITLGRHIEQIKIDRRILLFLGI